MSPQESGDPSPSPTVDPHSHPQQEELSRDIASLLGITGHEPIVCARRLQPRGQHHGQYCSYELTHADNVLGSLQRERSVPGGSHSLKQQAVSLLQDASSISDLFDRAERNGTDLVSHPDGLSLIRSALRQSYPEQWELREMGLPSAPSGEILSPGSWEYFRLLALPDRERPLYWSAQSYLDHYEFEMSTCAFITGAILTRCQTAMSLDKQRWSVLETAMTDCHNPRWTLMHRALWRIWTFCRIFGSGKGRECDWDGQRAWLTGQTTQSETECPSRPGSFHSEVLDNPPESFALGNQGGLSAEELEDMMFIWLCLQQLLRGHLERGPLPGFLHQANRSDGSALIEEARGGWRVSGTFLDSLLGLGLAAVRYLLSRRDRHPLRVAQDLHWTTDPVIQRNEGQRAFLYYACERRLTELGDCSFFLSERITGGNYGA